MHTLFPKHCMITQIHEIALSGLGLIGAATSALLLAQTPNEQAYALQWLLLPLVGALCSSVCAMLLNPQPETRKTVLARCIFGVVMGTAVPKLASMIHPMLKEWTLDPAFMFLAGFFICLVAYALARPLVEKLFARSSDFADHTLDALEKTVDTTTITHETTKQKPTEQPKHNEN